MKVDPESTIRVRVDPTNPGEFFACCGLLELADRLWCSDQVTGARVPYGMLAAGWFDCGDTEFFVTVPGVGHTAGELITNLVEAGLSGGLTPAHRRERGELETKRRGLKKGGGKLPEAEEIRREDLGKLLRAGPVQVGPPFSYVLDWWLNGREKGLFSAIAAGHACVSREEREERDDDAIPKTWAGTQQVLRIARAALGDTARAFETDRPFDYRRVMRCGPEEAEDEESAIRERIGPKSAGDKVEPFYFDSRHGANALPLDVGFSPDKLGMESKAFPAVELLCLIGLQRCRPVLTDTALIYEYSTWPIPLPVSVLPAAVCGLFGQAFSYRFENAYRTDQRKHSGYLPATRVWR